MNVFFKSLTIVISLFLTACASVEMAENNADISAKKFLPPPDGKASLYIYRNEIFGNTITKQVLLNGIVIGETAGQTYFHLNLQPGRYFIASPAGRSLFLESGTTGGRNTTIDLQGGKTYFVWQEIKAGGPAWLQIVNETTGKQGVKESELIALQLDAGDLRPSASSATGK